jgi:hypothetical protein|tara:strand:- start:1357 stop:1599 length:243 start_codon:yes stop_codon:yes gene_type:complete
MNVPRLYAIKNWKEKSRVMGKISNILSNLNSKEFPNVCNQLETNNSKIELIDTILVNLYSSNGSGKISSILSNLETTLND